MRHETILTPPVYRTRRIAGHAAWLARFALLFLLLSVAAHRFGRIGTPEFFWLLAAGGLMALLVLMMAATALRRAWQRGEPGAARAARAMLLALLLLAPYGFAGWMVVQLPALDDIATDPVDPPLFLRMQSQRGPAMNPLDVISAAEARQQVESYPAITGRRYPAAPDTVEQALQSVIQAQGWKLEDTRQSGEGETTLEASGRSMIFGFGFDLAFRITDEGETSYVDMRSATRYGAHDLGTNVRRILGFMEGLDLDMAARAGAGIATGDE